LKKDKSFILLVFVLIIFNLNAQKNLEFSFLCGVNGTLGYSNTKSIKGLKTAITPTTWSNSLQFSYNHNKHYYFFNVDFGALGLQIEMKDYPKIHPYSTSFENDGSTNISIITSIGGQKRKNTKLLQYTIGYKYEFLKHRNFNHQCQLGIGYFQTNTEKKIFKLSNIQQNEKIGYFEHIFEIDDYNYLRTQNLILLAGYNIEYEFSKHTKLILNLAYNHGLLNMIKVTSHRSYYEQNINYIEFESQDIISNFSHYTIQLGISYVFKEFSTKE
jgi:hypothetical protein